MKGYAVRRTPEEAFPAQGQGDPFGQLDIELTERCNLACIHCSINLPADDREAGARELDTAAWKDLLGQAADLGVLTIRVTGGEPLLRKDFPELYLHARRLGMKVLLFTNATLITPELAGLLARIPPLEPIEVSVYGMHAASYEAVTGQPGSYRRFRKGVQCLLDRRIPFVVKGARLPPNQDEGAAFAAWAATLPGMASPPKQTLLFELRSRRDSPTKNRQIQNLRLAPEKVLSLLTAKPDRYRREMAGFFERCPVAPGPRLFACGIGPGCVDAYGRFQPCLGLRHPDLCVSLRTASLKEAYGERYPRLREMVAADPRYLERCARCFLRALCDQCPAQAWSEQGALDRPVAYLCQVTHAQARFLGLLAEGEWSWQVEDAQARISNLKRSVTSP